MLQQNITFSDDLKKVKNADDLKKVKDGKMDIEEICLGCKSSNVEIVGRHPYFEGSLCKNHMVRDMLFDVYWTVHHCDS